MRRRDFQQPSGIPACYSHLLHRIRKGRQTAQRSHIHHRHWKKVLESNRIFREKSRASRSSITCVRPSRNLLTPRDAPLFPTQTFPTVNTSSSGGKQSYVPSSQLTVSQICWHLQLPSWRIVITCTRVKEQDKDSNGTMSSGYHKSRVFKISDSPQFPSRKSVLLRRQKFHNRVLHRLRTCSSALGNHTCPLRFLPRSVLRMWHREGETCKDNTWTHFYCKLQAQFDL